MLAQDKNIAEMTLLISLADLGFSQMMGKGNDDIVRSNMNEPLTM